MREILLCLSGIILPGLALVWLLRRWVEPIRWSVALGFLLLVLSVLGGAIFTSKMPVPLDEVIRGYPYRGIFGDVLVRNSLTNDTVKLFLPWMDTVRDDLFGGRAPLWNRYAFSGYPLLGNGESAPFSPFFLATLLVPLPKQLVAMAALKLFVSLLFTYLYLRSLNVSTAAAVFGAAVFSLCVYQNVYLYYSATAVSALLPVTAFALRRCFTRPQPASFFVFAIVVGCLLAAGHPESVFHVAVGAAALIVIEVLTRGDKRGVLVCVAATIFGLLISAPVWVPVFEQVLQSERLTEISGHRLMTPAMPASAGLTLFNPDALGNPARGTWWGPLNYSVLASSHFGLLALALLPVSLFGRANRYERGLALLSVGLFLIAMNWTGFGHFVNAIPPFPFVANDKLRFVAVFFAVCAASMAVARIDRERLVITIGGATAILTVAIAILIKQSLPAYATAGCIALGLFIVSVLALYSHKLAHLIPVIATALTIGELAAFNWPFNALVDAKYFRPSLPIIDRIRTDASEEPFRIVGHDWVFLQNAAAHYRLEDVRGSDPMAWGPYVTFFRLIETADRSFGVARIQNVMHPAVAFLNVHYLLAEPGFSVGFPWKQIYEGPDGILYRHERPIPRFYTPAHLVGRREGVPLLAQLEVLTDFREAVVVDGAAGPNQVIESIWIRQFGSKRFRLTLEAPERMFIASSQPAAPGWRVRVNKKPVRIMIVNGAFIGFWVPPGKNQVVLDYRPLSFYGSLLLMFVAVAAAVGWATLRSRNKG